MNPIEGFENQIFAHSFFSSIADYFKLDWNLEVWNSKTTNFFLYTPRCQINKSTRLSFWDFSPTLYLDMSYVISHPTCLFGPTHFAFPPYSFIWPYFLWNLHRISTLLIYLAPESMHPLIYSYLPYTFIIYWVHMMFKKCVRNPILTYCTDKLRFIKLLRMPHRKMQVGPLILNIMYYLIM